MRLKLMRQKFLLATFFACASVPAFADEGMWTFDNFPAAQVKQKFGVTIDKKWLDHVQASAVRLAGGCSASVVSPNGLVLTNHHCVAGCAQNLSSPDHDYVKNGFTTARPEDEKQCPGTQAEILQTIGDVTPTINAATAGKAGDAFGRARDAAVADVEKQACMGREATHRCQVIGLYDGGQYKLYTYRKYSDVRLVFAVEFDTAFFGGDPDNFNFPRYDLDFSFLRLYENGRPVTTPEHLTWNASAPTEGEPVFVAGNPGGTDRQLTEAQLTTLRDVTMPLGLILGSELRGRLTRFSEESPEHARIANRDLFGLENGLKAQRGEEQALLQPSLFENKRKADAALKAKVDADPKLHAEIGDPWSEIAKAQEQRVALAKPYYFLESRAGGGATLFRYARTLVRAAEERGKPNGERLREYADARLPLVEKTLLDPQPVETDLEQLKLEFWLTKLREELTADAPETKLVLGKDSSDNLAHALSASKLFDPNLRKQLWEGGIAAVRASSDPMILFVLKIDDAGRAVRKAYEEKVEGPTDRASERIAKARFAVYGQSVYPDATFSLRLTYGKIAGWTEPGRTIAPFTNFAGLYDRATGQPPFQLAPRWGESKSKLDLNTVFNMSSDNDIIGGNSGSPLINAKGEVIGAIFDGNIHSLGGDYYFDEKLNRAVSVSTAAITEALNKVYGQSGLIAELTHP
ncbi:MAG TPA: S46 family peptidase [Micropepsaceae bacterium]|nr:S46 family peptidase [Micropepsaceae bacterium]